MGQSLSWLAIQGGSAALLREQLRLEVTTEAAEPGETTFVGATFPGGWFVIVADRCDHELISDKNLRTLSTHAPAIACSIEEHVMFSSAALWQSGALWWQVRHQGDDNMRDLVAEGSVPPAFEAIRRDCAAKQDEEEHNEPGDRVDWFFEIPLELARSITGFKHDEDLPAGVAFTALRALAGSPVRHPWWRIW